jgi:hypothetical protein
MIPPRAVRLWRGALLVAWLWGVTACAAEVGLGHVMLSEERAKHPVLGNMNEILRSLTCPTAAGAGRSLRMTGIGLSACLLTAASFCTFECRRLAV